jgi:excinuclease ABC subunit A
MYVRIFISRYRGYATCLACHGERLRQEARDVLIGGKSITEVTRMTIAQASDFFAALTLSAQQASIAERILTEIRHRLDLLLRVGLEYIALDRVSSTLSGGESQRIQLATSLGSSLVGALYVLDEPSIGLHPRGTKDCGNSENPEALGNTVLVVEHDAEIMKSADHLIDLGPRAGEHGGEVMFQGSYPALMQDSKSLTSRYLNGDLKISTPVFRRKHNGSY